jgi:uncharacterized protein YqeY
MTLEILQKEMIAAMKAKDKIRKDTISSIIGNIKTAAINDNCRNNISEQFVDKVLLKEQKTMQEMIDTCPAERVETLNEYKAKMEIIKEFAPKLLTDEEEIKKKIYHILATVDIQKDGKGAVMKAVMPQLKGKVDMKVANKVLNEILKKSGEV